jgi:hypothetical protein
MQMPCRELVTLRRSIVPVEVGSSRQSAIVVDYGICGGFER